MSSFVQAKITTKWLYGHAMLGTRPELLHEAGDPQLDDKDERLYDSLNYKTIAAEVISYFIDPNIKYPRLPCAIFIYYCHICGRWN